LGVDLVSRDDGGDAETRELSPNQPTLETLASEVAMPVSGGDTAAASHAILQRLKEMS